MRASKNYSDTLLELYRGAQQHNVTSFAPFAIGVIQKYIAFDSAMFGLLSQNLDGQLLGHHMYVHNEDASVGEEWRALAARDTVLRAMLSNLGRSIPCQVSTVLTAPEDAELLSYARRRGHMNVLSMALPYGASELRFAISLRRADHDWTYDQKEALVLEEILPHICEAFRINQTLFAKSVSQPGHEQFRGICIFDNSGTIVYQDTAFANYAKFKFKDYEGFKVPNHLREEFCGDLNSKKIVGKMVMHIKKIGDFHFLLMRSPSRLAALTDRELSVAKFYGTGLTNKEIGVELAISPQTVRKHVEAVYAKLNINNKADLAYLIHSSSGSTCEEKMFAPFESKYTLPAIVVR